METVISKTSKKLLEGNIYKVDECVTKHDIPNLALALLQEYGFHKIKFFVPPLSKMNINIYNESIEYLNLSTRSNTAILRKRIKTIGQLIEATTDQSSLMYNIRGIGIKSATEIMYSLFVSLYDAQSPADALQWLEEVIEMNIETEI